MPIVTKRTQMTQIYLFDPLNLCSTVQVEKFLKEWVNIS